LTGLYSIALGVPLAVLAEAAGPYDDPKVWALLILTAGTGLAWLVHAWKRPGRPSQAPDMRARVLRGIILCCASWWIITTATSIAPLQSLLGTFGRGMGLLTMASAALIFFLVQSECRTPRAVRSIVDVALLGSVPVCLLALGQAGGWDPLPKPWDPAVTGLAVRSTFGQHMFLGSYLVVLIPLTAARLEWALSDRRESAAGLAPASVQWLPILVGAAWVAGAVGLVVCGSYWPLARWGLVAWGVVGAAVWAFRDDAGGRRDDTVLSASLLAGLLVVQVLVVVLSRGRGGFVGMLVGLSVTALAVLVRRRVWKTLTAVGLGLVALIGLLALLNSSRAPAIILSHMGPLSRLSEAANMRPGTPAWFRVQVWRGILDGWSRQLHGEEVIPGMSPRMRSIIGYGPETQILVLDSMAGPFLGVLRTKSAAGRRSYQYVADRAHNVLLEQLVTGGLGGVALWGLLVGSLVVVGIARIRASASHGEATMRLGALGAVCGHLAEGQVGIATAMPLVLFWLGAALLTSEPWTTAANLSSVALQRVAPRRGWRWSTALAIAALLTVLIAWTSTRWLLASVAFADGARHGAAGQTAEAHRDFQRSVALAPGLPLPAEGAAYTAFRLAGRESDPATRRELLSEAAAVLIRARHQAAGSVASWTLTAQVAFAQARAGDRSKLAASLDAFGAADRLRPNDPELLAQWAWAWLASGDAARARETAERALAREPGEWLAWAVLARAARELGDGAEAERARGRARQLTPPEARRLVDTIAP
jgi:cytochrome c-type biogenesis protein CcmH/NrfG